MKIEKQTFFNLFLCLIFTVFIHIGCTSAENQIEMTMDTSGPIVPVMNGDEYQNWIPTPKIVYSIPKMIWHNIKTSERTKPEEIIPVIRPTPQELNQKPSTGLTVRWLGHSSLLIEIAGYRLMIDPVLSKYASPVPGFVKRFSAPPVFLADLPQTDLVLISHDHYDHLDKDTIRALAGTRARFLVPLGVDKILKDWGIEEHRIQSATWWQEIKFETLKLICVPARHFSGRNPFYQNSTLWSGWAIQSRSRSVFYSGDSGYGNHFEQIGEKLGPFDLAIIENGAYNDAWPYVHSNSINAVQACLDVKGRRFLPVHWSTFDLSNHAWDEPIIESVKEADKKAIQIITPRIGELVDLDKPLSYSDWWTGIE